VKKLAMGNLSNVECLLVRCVVYLSKRQVTY